MNNNSRAPLGDKTNTAKEGNITSCQKHGIYYVYVNLLIQLYLQSMLKNVRGKGIEPDGFNKRMQLIRGVVHPIIRGKNQHVLGTTNCNAS